NITGVDTLFADAGNFNSGTSTAITAASLQNPAATFDQSNAAPGEDVVQFLDQGILVARVTDEGDFFGRNVNLTDTVFATAFVGDGSFLTGVGGSTDLSNVLSNGNDAAFQSIRSVDSLDATIIDVFGNITSTDSVIASTVDAFTVITDTLDAITVITDSVLLFNGGGDLAIKSDIQTGSNSLVVPDLGGVDDTLALRSEVLNLPGGQDGNNNIFVGQGTGGNLSFGTGQENALFGIQAGSGIQNGNRNVVMGAFTAPSLFDGNENIVLGNEAGLNMTAASRNVFLGDSAGLNSDSQDNVYIGNAAGITDQTGTGNTLVGSGADVGLIGGANATAIGANANAFSLGTAIGANAQVTANDGVAIGIGSAATANNSIAIGTNTISNNNNTIILGDGTNSNFDVGIGLQNPTEKLEVAGDIAADSVIANFFVGDGSFLTNVGGLTLPFSGSSNDPTSAFDIFSDGDGVTASFVRSSGTDTVTMYVESSQNGGVAIFKKSSDNALPSIIIDDQGFGSYPAIEANRGIVIGNLLNADVGGAIRYTGTTFEGNIGGGSGGWTDFVGFFTEDANDNIFGGLNAGLSLGGGNQNLIFGSDAGAALDDGAQNIFIGNQSGEMEVNGSSNIFIGYQAGFSAMGASGNTVLGSQSSQSLTAATNNTIIGTNSGTTLQDGQGNVIIGSSADVQVNTDEATVVGTGSFAIDSAVALGSNAGVTGFRGIGIGFNSIIDAPGSIGLGSGTFVSASNAVAIGANTNATSDNTIILGDGTNSNFDVGIGLDVPERTLHISHADDPAVGGLEIQNNGSSEKWTLFSNPGLTPALLLYTGGSTPTLKGLFNFVTGAYTEQSDARLKKNIDTLEPVLNKVLKTKVHKYHFKTQDDTDQKNIGVIAQELKEIFPSLVQYTDDQDIYTVDYSGLAPVAIKAIQELLEIINAQQQEIDKLSTENKSKEDQLGKLESDMQLIKDMLGISGQAGNK
ncbi:MAG TPA: tail fiber domain-containing protein, partial [Cyclobacteriaceae bacterium]